MPIELPLHEFVLWISLNEREGKSQKRYIRGTQEVRTIKSMRIKGMMKKKNDRGLNYKVTVRHKNNKVFSFWEDEVNLEHVWSDILFGLRDSFVCELAT